MHKRRLTLNDLQNSASQQTREVREMAQNLSFWLDGVHHPSEGENLEYVVRSYLRRRIPKCFEISTGFISTLEATSYSDGELEATRRTSRQFDILIWDANTFPPLFRADDFVVLIPESVKAIIEVTKSLSSSKMREDLEKFDDLHDLYSPDRQLFRPFTAMLAFSSNHSMKVLLQFLERFYLFNSTIPIQFRYRFARAKGLDTRPLPLHNFVDSICILNKGLLKGGMEIARINPRKSVIEYTAYSNEPDVEIAFGLFERDLVLSLSQSAAQASGYWESSVDTYREFMHMGAVKACISLVIEDWDSVLPSLNVMDKQTPITSRSPSRTTNVSNFVGADFTCEHPRPTMFIEDFGSKIWAFERHPNNLYASGCYNKGSRVDNWRIFSFDERQQKSTFHLLDTKKRNFQELLEKLKATAWENQDPRWFCD